VRYFEFDFVRSQLPATPSPRCLDVSSPYLFPLWLLAKRPGTAVRMINPDPVDIASTQAIARTAGIVGLDARCEDLREAAAQGRQYDLVTSISVIEHIAGPYDDRAAIAMMWDAVAPGGRLLLTFPVDRAARDEFRSATVYSSRSAPAATNAESAPAPVFFQRFYTAATIAERLLAPLGSPPHHTAWFGEVAPGRYATHAERWRAEGLAATVSDPALIADSFRRFAAWDEMPGMGVCGLRIDKPAQQVGA
jgi:SAM-dependent methyltransferase